MLNIRIVHRFWQAPVLKKLGIGLQTYFDYFQQLNNRYLCNNLFLKIQSRSIW